MILFPLDFEDENDAIPDQLVRMFLTLLIHLCVGQVGCDDNLVRIICFYSSITYVPSVEPACLCALLVSCSLCGTAMRETRRLLNM